MKELIHILIADDHVVVRARFGFDVGTKPRDEGDWRGV